MRPVDRSGSLRFEGGPPRGCQKGRVTTGRRMGRRRNPQKTATSKTFKTVVKVRAKGRVAEREGFEPSIRF